MENTVVQPAGSTRLLQPVTAEALDGIAMLFNDLAEGVRTGNAIHVSGSIQFNNNMVDTMEVVSDLKFNYKE